ncbi:MAG TPA: glycosyltransferase family 39 protein, partial [Pirellulales bacterium]|nr:glycosyltransferase family 39 protein [Pirellulales bacterium]
MDRALLPSKVGRRWFFEPQLGLLVLLVAGAYFSRLGDLTIRGEETRRARVAIEMLESGDFIVPREQGRLFPDRPPLGNWAIALSMAVFGSHDVVAVRLPTVLATLLTTILIYGYSRTFLTAFGALAAGAAYATMGQVLQLGFLAETEAMLTLCTGASLLVWHAGYLRGWPKLGVWTAGYALAALAALAKGPQGPLYFGGAVVVYLMLRRDWRWLFSPAHLAGIAVFAAIVGAWQVPYSLEVEWDKVLQTWGHTSAARFDYSQPWPVVRHLLSYPWEILGCLLPWSPWLAAYSNRDFRRSLGPARDPAIFLAVAILVAFPTCWLAPQARGRYFMPLYPCFAPLIGLVIERAEEACRLSLRERTPFRSAKGALARMWRAYFTTAAILLVLAGAAVLAISVAGVAQESPFSQSIGFAAVYAALASSAAWATWRARLEVAHSIDPKGVEFVSPGFRFVATAAVAKPQSATSKRACRGDGPSRASLALLALAAFMGLSCTGLMTNSLIRRSEDIAGRVAALKQRLPADVRLV